MTLCPWTRELYDVNNFPVFLVSLPILYTLNTFNNYTLLVSSDSDYSALHIFLSYI